MSYFKPLRRKLGLVTLLLACLTSSGWTRSLRTADDISFASIHLLSVHGGVFVEDLSDLPNDRSFDFKSRGASGYLNAYQDSETNHVWKWRRFGLAIGRREVPSRSVKGRPIPTKRYYYVRYYVPLIILTAMSAWLLLSIPRAKARRLPASVQRCRVILRKTRGVACNHRVEAYVMAARIELHTERLVLRPFQTGDVSDALAYRDDEEFARFLSHIPLPFTRQDSEAFVRRNMPEPWDKSPTFAVVLDGKLIGTVNLEVNSATRTAMIGYAIGRAWWDRGIATEAARAAMSWGIETFDLSRIWASTDVRNIKSQRVMEKLGMKRESLQVAHNKGRNGELIDEVVYGLDLNHQSTQAPGRGS